MSANADDTREDPTVRQSRRPPAEPERRPSFAPGALVDDAYRVLGTLGEGGMGTVLLARDVRLDRDVALKVVRAELAAREDYRVRFRDEARAMARVRHPHVVGVHAFGEAGGRPYFVMDYVPGVSLHRHVAGLAAANHGGRLRLDRALGVLDQLGRGIAALHAAGIVHRDVKPANVLVGPAGRVAIGDLGLSRTVRDVGGEDDWGTPGYSAPETVDPTPPRPDLATRVDVYGMGVIAFELLTGRLPFPDERDRLAAMLEERPIPAASALVPELPVEVDEVLRGALAWRPEERTASADQLRRELLRTLRPALPPITSLRIVVVDDDESYRDLSARLVAALFPSAEIVCVEGAREALVDIAHHGASIVLTDLDMPETTGAELAATLRRDPRTAGIPVVIASAIGGSSDWSLLGALGVDVFLAKPFDPVQLELALRNALP